MRIKKKEVHHNTGKGLLDAMTGQTKTAGVNPLNLIGAAGGGYAAHKLSKKDKNRKFKTLAGAALGYGAGNVLAKKLMDRRVDQAVNAAQAEITASNAQQFKAGPKTNFRGLQATRFAGLDKARQLSQLKAMKKVHAENVAFVKKTKVPKGDKHYHLHEKAINSMEYYAKKIKDFEATMTKTAANPMHYALAGGGVGGLAGAALNKKDRKQGALAGAITGAAAGGLGSMLGSRAGQSATIPTAPKIEIDTKIVTKSMDKVKQHAQRKAHELHSKGLQASMDSIGKKLDSTKADIAKLKKELKGNFPDFNEYVKRKDKLADQERKLGKLQEMFNDKSKQFIDHFPNTYNF